MKLDRLDIMVAYKMAVDHQIKYENFEHAHYKNTLFGHFIAKLGEFGAYRWLQMKRLDPVPNFLTDDNTCDIFLRGKLLRCEVKTWREHQWQRLGHAINEDQFGYVRSKADAVIYCTVRVPFGVRTAEEMLEYCNKVGVLVIPIGWNRLCEFDNVLPQIFKENNKASRQIETTYVRQMEIL